MTTLQNKKAVSEDTSPKGLTAATNELKEKAVKDKAQQRHNKIAEAAYYIAEKQGFDESSEYDNWLAAEAEIDMKWSNHH